MMRCNKPFYLAKDMQAINNVLANPDRAYPEIAVFESKIAEMANTSKAIAVANGTVSLEAIYNFIGVNGKEVITTALTWKAAIHAIVRAGGTPVFVDIGPDFLIDVEKIEEAITDKTVAITATHLYGMMCDMPAIRRIADSHALYLVEDAAQAHGALRDGIWAGSEGNFGSFSFYSTKNISGGEGGAISCSSFGEESLRLYCNNGIVQALDGSIIVGTNYRINPLGAALASSQIDDIEAITTIRNQNADQYNEYLGHAYTQHLGDSDIHSMHQYTILVDDRDAVVERLDHIGVTAGIYYSPEMLSPFCGAAVEDLPVTKDVTQRCISLPVQLTADPYIIKKISKIVKEHV